MTQLGLYGQLLIIRQPTEVRIPLGALILSAAIRQTLEENRAKHLKTRKVWMAGTRSYSFDSDKVTINI